MDTGITASIQARRDALYRYYDLPAEAKQKAEALFARMEEFGKECKEQTEFERKFITLTMNHEYNDLFVAFTAYVKKPDSIPSKGEMAKEMAADYAKGEVEYRAREKTREIVYGAVPGQWTDPNYGVTRIPLIGGILSLLHWLEALRRLFRRRRKKNGKRKR